MAKHKGQKAKKQKGRGPGGTLSKKQKMQSNKAKITAWLQNKVARGAKYEKLRAHGAAGNWKLFAHVLSNAWKKKGGAEQDTRFLQNSFNARDVYWAVFGGAPAEWRPSWLRPGAVAVAAAPVAAPVVAAAPAAPVAAPPAPAAAPVAAAAPPPPPATVLQPGAEEGELDEALAAEFVPC